MKMNIIGKFNLFLLSLAFFNLNFGQAHLKILDLNGVRLKEAGVGVPFILKVDIETGANDNIKPEIEGLDNKSISAHYEGTSSTLTNIAGQVSVERSFKYILRIDSEGVYKLGPAKLYIQGDTIESNVIALKVGPEQISKRKKKSQELVEIKTEVDKFDLYQGQKLNFKLSLRGKGQLNVVGISEPNLKDFNIGQIDGPVQNVDYEKGQKVLTYVWNYTLYPRKCGKVVIPSVSAVLKVPDESSDSSLFSSFFNSFKKETVTSNSIILNVKALPQDLDKPVADKSVVDKSIVGKFYKFEMSLDKNELDQGDAALLKLSIQGESDLDNIDLNIENAPEDLKIYKSNSYIDSDTKIFEFIVQGLKEGEFIIPNQELAYFDPYSEKFDILKTASKKIKFNRSSNPVAIHQADTAPRASHKDEDSVHHHILDSDIYYFEPYRFSSFLFIIILLFPIWLLFVYFLGLKIRSLRRFKILKLKRQLEHSPDLYAIFLELIALKTDRKASQISVQDMSNLIDDKKWIDFVHRLIEMKYANVIPSVEFKQESKHWFKILEKEL